LIGVNRHSREPVTEGTSVTGILLGLGVYIVIR